MYDDLVYATPGLKAARRATKYFKDATFGVKPDDVERTYTPRDDVTIVRDKGFGVPHIYGDTRAARCSAPATPPPRTACSSSTSCATSGRAQLSSFAGGAPRQPRVRPGAVGARPYTEADLQRQVDQLDDLLRRRGRRHPGRTSDYVAGVNAYIAEARLNPARCPASTRRSTTRRARRLEGHRRDRDRRAGRRHLRQGRRPRGRAGARPRRRRASGSGARGQRVWARLPLGQRPRGADHRPQRQALPLPARRSARRPPGRALPDGAARQRAGGRSATPTGARTARQRAAARRGDGTSTASPAEARSNALLVSAPSRSRPPARRLRPADRLLRAADPDGAGHPRAGHRRPRRGVVPGVNLYVQLGRGRDYSWSATSAGRDIIDTFAVELCEPGGSPPTLVPDALPVPRPVPADRGARAHELLVPNAGRPTPRAARRCAKRTRTGSASSRPRRPSRASRSPTRACARPTCTRSTRRAGSATSTTRTGSRRPRLPARGLEDRLHVQLVLRRRQAHRLLQLGQQPGAREGRRTSDPRPPRATSGAAGTPTI